MPSYIAKCKGCGEVFRYSSTIAKRNDPLDCWSCNSVAVRDIKAEFAAVGDRRKWVTDNERWSLSMGVPVAQLDEFRKRFPNSTYDSKGKLLIKNRKHKLDEMRKRDFVELDNRR